MSLGRRILGRRHVLPSVCSTLSVIQLEGTFATGTHLVTVDLPIGSDDGDLEMALYGSFMPVPSEDAFPAIEESEYDTMKMPGAILPSPAKGNVELNPGRKRVQVRVTNKGDRPVQVSCSRCAVLVSVALTNSMSRGR
jgi:urease